MKETDTVFRNIAMARLSAPDELTEVLSITRPADWLILSALALLLVGGLVWASFASLEVCVAADDVLHNVNDAHKAVLFVSDVRAGQIRPGLAVRLSLKSDVARKHGFIAGSVTGVRPVSARAFHIDVSLRPDRTTEGLPAQSGVEAHIVLRRERPIDAALPWLRASKGGS